MGDRPSGEAEPTSPSTERRHARLLDAYLADVVDLPTFERKRAELSRRHEVLEVQQRQVAATAQQHLDLDAAAASIDASSEVTL